MPRSGNPAFSQTVINNTKITNKTNSMSLARTYLKTFILLALVMVSAAISWQWMKADIATSSVRWVPLWVTSLSTFFMAMVISFRPTSARVLAPIYAVLQGALLGIISGTFAYAYEGIVGQAVFLTLAVFLAVYVGYAVGILRATPAFARVIITAMLGYLMFSLLAWIFSLFGLVTPVINAYGTYGIIFSLLIVLVAALSLVLDFDFIDAAAGQNYPKYFEWYGAFGLMVGLIWLYMEILRLLARLAARSQS
jgi:uncharacterized YccA/Bax inhibitor family protein